MIPGWMVDLISLHKAVEYNLEILILNELIANEVINENNFFLPLGLNGFK